MSKPIGIEQAIDAVKWDKRSTWEELRRKSNIKPWPIKYK